MCVVWTELSSQEPGYSLKENGTSYFPLVSQTAAKRGGGGGWNGKEMQEG